MSGRLQPSPPPTRADTIRRRELDQVRIALEDSPVAALLGARQIGKTTLARQVQAGWDGPTHRFDLEDPADEGRLSDPGLALRPLRGLVVLDEIQRRPDLFPLLRVLADRPDLPAKFLLLGSASPDLLRTASESLAGRVAFVHLEGFGLDEVGIERWRTLWLRGGFPRSFLARSDAASLRWRRDFVRTFLERDLPQLAPGLGGVTMRRFWTMLAHQHGQVANLSALSRSLGITDSGVRRYLDVLAGTFVVRILLPWHENVGKRQVKRPKVFVADTGLLHALLGIRDRTDLEGHPILGASWESFATSAVVDVLGARREDCYFWATHAGAELDLLLLHEGRRLGFEFKHAEAPRTTKSMHAAFETLGLESLVVVHPGPHSYPLAAGIEALAIADLVDRFPISR